MAVTTSFPGIEVVVLVNGAKAQEYIDKHTRSREQNDEEVQRFIESVDDAEFAIRILINDDYKFLGHDALGIKVYVDGQYRCSTVWNKNHPKEYMYMRGSRVQKDDGGSSVRAFKFTAIETVEGEGKLDESALVNKQREDTEQTGEIAIFISRLKIKEKKMGLAGDGGKTTENQHSKLLFKANFKKKLTHSTGFGAEVESSKSAVRYTCTPIDGANNPIATFAFLYRAKKVLDDDLNVTPISEQLALPARKDSAMFMEQGPIQPPKLIKNEPNAIDDDASGDIYGATPLRQVQPPAHFTTPAPADNMAIFQNLFMTLGLTKEQKEILAQQLRSGVNNTAQNLKTPRPASQPVSYVAVQAAQDSIHIKQEGEEASGGRPHIKITIPPRASYQERQTGDGSVQIDLTTPVQETFIKPDPDATAQVVNQVQGTVIVEQGSATNNVTENIVALGFPNLEATQAAVRASMKKSRNARQGSASTVDGIATPKTPDSPVQEPALEGGIHSQMHSGDAMQTEQVEKPTTTKGFSSPVEVDVIASIEASDHAPSAAGISHRKDSILSDASMDLNAVLQRARSGRPTITTVHSEGADRFTALSPTAPPAETHGVVSHEATEPIPVETTGRDIREHSIKDDSHSPSRQLIGNFDLGEGFEIIYSPIKGVENTILGTPLPAVRATKKPTGAFETNSTTEVDQATSDPIQTSKATASPLTSEKPIMSFEQTMARAKSKKTSKPTISTERATTPFPTLLADVEIPATPTAAPEDVALPASEVHTGDHGFIDIESVVAVPVTPVKRIAPHGLKKIDDVTTPTTSKVTPKTLDRLLSASRKGMESLDLTVDVGTPRKRIIFSKDRAPSSKYGEDKIGAPVTGNAGGSGKKTTPIKRERYDEENDGVEVKTPTKKIKYLKLGNQDKPISFDSDDE